MVFCGVFVLYWLSAYVSAFKKCECIFKSAMVNYVDGVKL